MAAISLVVVRSSSVGHYPSPDITITYRVRGTAGHAHITYQNETNGTTIAESTNGPAGELLFDKQVSLQSGDIAYLTAQNAGETGSIIVEIWYNGDLARRSESSGAYCIATVSGKV